MKQKKVADEKLTLNAQIRTILGKKVKQLRRDGKIPANIYGESIPSQAITVQVVDFRKIYKKAGETQVIYLKIADQTEEIPVLVNIVQKHPISDNILHIEFRKVDLKKKIETQVPIVITGDSEAVTQNKGILQTITDSILVEALPDKIPTQIEIDITNLKEVNDQVLVKNIASTVDYVIKDDLEKTIVRITEHKEEEITPQTEAVAPEITTEKVADSEEETGDKSEKTDTGADQEKASEES